MKKNNNNQKITKTYIQNGFVKIFGNVTFEF